MIIFVLITLFLFSIVFVLFFNFAFSASENIFGLLFNRPFYVHFYSRTERLSVNQRYVLYNQVPFFSSLNPKYKKHFEHRVSKFISKYKFIGKDNFIITDEVKVLIASTSVMLTFGMRSYLYGIIDVIIVYPSQYYSTINNVYHQGEFNPRMRAVVFSWEHFRLGIENTTDNLNLGIHEFAHVLNYQSLKSDNASANIFSKKYYQIQKMIKQKEIIDELINSDYFRTYAFVNSVEFIAVVLEQFFETPEQFKELFPELFHKVKQMINYNEKYFR